MNPKATNRAANTFEPDGALTNIRELTADITGDPIILGLPARFWGKIALPSNAHDCWLWIPRCDRGGYGQFHLGMKCFRAHRLAYEALIGDIPADLQLDHTCRTRSCVNPAHLEPVTQRENILRGEAPSAKHARKTECPRGHRYDEENTYRYPDGRRSCRTCRAIHRGSHRSRKAGAR